MAAAISDPLFGPAPDEIQLPNAPLVRVVSQVRISEILKIADKEFIAGFQESIRREYPILQKDDIQSVVLDASGVAKLQARAIWRFFDEEKIWRVSLSTDFVAIETRSYSSRTDFIGRLNQILEATKENFDPSLATRVGVRYIDQVKKPQLDNIQSMVKPEMIGIVVSELHKKLKDAISEALFEIKEGELRARWGLLPPDTSYEPTSIPAIGEESWFLDLDAFNQATDTSYKYETEALTDMAKSLAERVYTVFRWTVNDEFLRAYGGKL